MFSQASCQPQVLTAVGQVSFFVNTVRQGLLGSVHSHRGACAKHNRQTRTATTEQGKNDCSNMASDLQKQEEEFMLAVESLDMTKELEALSRSLAVTNGIFSSPWRQSHVSADTFFENRHGFPEPDLKDCLPVSRSQVNDLFKNRYIRRLLENPRHSDFIQTRGFKTRAGSGSSGIGTRREQFSPEVLLLDTIHKLRKKINVLDGDEIKKQEAKSGEVSRELEAAYSQGLKQGEKKEKQKNLYKKYLKYFLVGLIIWYVVSPALNQGRAELDVGKLLGGGGQRVVDPEMVTVTFDNVRGVDEAKQELIDVVEYLRNPEWFKAVGAVLPKGVLLVGPPGIGKTMLAKAVAGEAGVPFFYASGSEFDEVFVGSGARKVRHMFASAKARAPCVVFIDEIDSVGGKRTSSTIHPYANQTINQLLSEMDGFNPSDGVIVLGATNRRDNLDRALLRPGRFDVEVKVMPPDFKGRMDIFKLYLGKVAVDESVNPEKLARDTTGFTGADIQNMVNQAALKAGQERVPLITAEHMEYARDKIQMGPAWKNKQISKTSQWNTAYHEAGHTLVAYFTKDAPPLRKVTILPRGPSLGHTAFTQDEELEHHQTKAMLLGQLDMAMGGRVGEEIIYGPGKVTTGAFSDFKGATEIATNMVKSYGMSEKVGIRVYGHSAEKEDISTSDQELIDNEIKRILNESYERAKNILTTHATEHKLLAQALIDYETLDKEEVEQIIRTKKPFKKNLKNGK